MSASRVVSILFACVTGILGFFAFNIVDGIFGVPEAILGISACIATTIVVFRRRPPREADTDV